MLCECGTSPRCGGVLGECSKTQREALGCSENAVGPRPYPKFQRRGVSYFEVTQKSGWV